MSATDIIEIEVALKELFGQKITAAKKIDPIYGELLAHTAKLVGRGGKRGRPRLVLEAYRAYGGTNTSAIVKVAASQELFHAFILMHDDIIDRDHTRWGGPNISGVYYRLLSKKMQHSEAQHMADCRALLAGDICHTLAGELLLDSDFSAPLVLKATSLMHHTMLTLVGGELLDVAVSDGSIAKSTITKKRLLTVSRTKTAAYSFSMPLQIGAMLAEAPQRALKTLEEFGEPAGIAFQLRDDILGIFGQEKQLGKSTLSDIREGKRTILMHDAIQHATPAQRRQLDDIVGNQAADYQDLLAVQHILAQSGALERTEKLAASYVQKASIILAKTELPIALSTYLHQVIDHAANRQK